MIDGWMIFHQKFKDNFLFSKRPLSESNELSE